MQRRTWLGFAALCLLTGSRWLLDQVVPPPMSPLLRTGLHDALLCLLLCGWTVFRFPGSVSPDYPWRAIAFTATCVFALPYAVIEAAGGSVTGFTETLVFTLIPAFVVFFAAQQSWEFGDGADPRRLLGPALAGVFGAALVIEFRWPSSTAGRLWLIALIASALLASYATIGLHSYLQRVPTVPVAALTGGIIALTGGVFSWTSLPQLRALDAHGVLVELAVALLLDGPLLLLSIWLLRELPPVAFATRYLLFLVVTIVETYLIVRPPLVWTTAAGVLLMAGGAAWLLRESPYADSSNTSPL